MQDGNKDIMFLISGCNNYNQTVYSIHTETQNIKLKGDNLVAYGMEVPNFKNNLIVKKISPDIPNIFALELSIVMITTALKTSVLFDPDFSITLDKIKEASQMPEFEEFDAKICEPYDYINCQDNISKVNIVLDKEEKLLKK